MDKDGVSSIPGPDVLATNDLIDIEEDHLNHGHDDELDRTGRADDDTKADQDTGAGKVSSDQTDDVDVDKGTVGVAIFVVDKLPEFRITTIIISKYTFTYFF